MFTKVCSRALSKPTFINFGERCVNKGEMFEEDNDLPRFTELGMVEPGSGALGYTTYIFTLLNITSYVKYLLVGLTNTDFIFRRAL